MAVGRSWGSSGTVESFTRDGRRRLRQASHGGFPCATRGRGKYQGSAAHRQIIWTREADVQGGTTAEISSRETGIGPDGLRCVAHVMWASPGAGTPFAMMMKDGRDPPCGGGADTIMPFQSQVSTLPSYGDVPGVVAPSGTSLCFCDGTLIDEIATALGRTPSV